MGRWEEKKDNYYYQCVKEANKEANRPFSVAEIEDVVKVRVSEDIDGDATVKGMGYLVTLVQEDVLYVKPLSRCRQVEYLHSHVLEGLSDSDFTGVRKVRREDTFIIQKVNAEKYMWYLREQKKAYGVVNQDAYYGFTDRFVSDGVQL
ncbi:hypothetical protein [Bacillus sp. NEAU-Y102]